MYNTCDRFDCRSSASSMILFLLEVLCVMGAGPLSYSPIFHHPNSILSSLRPSATLLEYEEMYSPKSKPASDTNYMSRKEYLESMRKRAEQADGTFGTTPSKAWYQFQEEIARQNTSSSAAPMYGEGDDFKPIPIVTKAPSMVKAPPAANKPLKSAMKKPPSVKKE